jgi:hypothetical protein
MSRDHADLSPVIGQSALATLGTLEEDLTDDWGEPPTLVLMTPAHEWRFVHALAAETGFKCTSIKDAGERLLG